MTGRTSRVWNETEIYRQYIHPNYVIEKKKNYVMFTNFDAALNKVDRKKL